MAIVGGAVETVQSQPKLGLVSFLGLIWDLLDWIRSAWLSKILGSPWRHLHYWVISLYTILSRSHVLFGF